jgi:hypothetical protein
MPWERLLLATLLLGSCDRLGGGVSLDDRMTGAEINLRNVARASTEMVDRVERAERRIDDLERKVRDLERGR